MSFSRLVIYLLKLDYKKRSEDASSLMKEAIYSNHDYYTGAIEGIQELLPSNETHILNSANSCILTVVEALPEPILIPDEGGWNGLERSAKILKKQVDTIDTDDGIINIEYLHNYLKNNNVGSIYITTLAGYTALQPVNEIFELCALYDVILVLDISGTVGSNELSSQEHCDIQVCSTGSPKIVNIENGGFINNITQKLKFNNHLLKTFKADNITCAGISNEITKAPLILDKTIKLNTYLKKELSKKLEDDTTHNVIHSNSIGINTIFTTESKSKTKKLAYNIRQKLDITDNKSIITTGPNYNRLKKPCVAIEVKNLDINQLNQEKIDELIEIIIESINEQ